MGPVGDNLFGRTVTPVNLEIRSPKSFKMNPDPGFGRSISYEAHFEHAMLQMNAGRKTADSLVPRNKSRISPRNVSDGERTRPRIYKKNISRDTKLAVGRELAKSNLLRRPVLGR